MEEVWRRSGGSEVWRKSGRSGGSSEVCRRSGGGLEDLEDLRGLQKVEMSDV